MTRKCRDCRECCIVMAIDEIEKPYDQPCPHLCRRGCDIYQQRPDECAIFDCFYRMKLVPAWMRPNKTHAVIWPGTVQDDDGRIVQIIRVNFNSAFKRDNRVIRWAQRNSHKYLVIMAYKGRFEAVLNGTVWDAGGEGDTWRIDVTDGRVTGIIVERPDAA